MVGIDDVEGLAAAMPEATVGERYGRRTWFVGKKAFVWERPFSKADIKRFGTATPPEGPIVAIATGDLAEKEALLTAHPEALFTIAHFDGFPAVLVQLRKIGLAALSEVVVDGWLAVAPAKVAEEYLRRTD